MKKKDAIFLFLVIVFICVFVIIANIASSKSARKSLGGTKNEQNNLLSGKHYVLITVKNYGNIKVELDADTAPITVTNFINLVNDNFYDGLTFHRIMEGFMIQGGGYNIDGSEKDAHTIKGEFLQNGIVNNISHKRGVISMARSNDYNSGSSQFFIMHQDNISLDGRYAAFGYVISGMDVVDKIAKKAKPTDNNGSIAVEDRPVIESIRVVEE